MILNDSENSIVKIRDQYLLSVSVPMDTGSNFQHNNLIGPGTMSSRWIMLQLLAGHPNPKKVLFLGATLGGDIIGACNQGHRRANWASTCRWAPGCAVHCAACLKSTCLVKTH